MLHYNALSEYSDFRTGDYSFCSEQGHFGLTDLTQHEAEYIWHFLRPYVCVIHRATKRGYYLNRNYQLIVSVQDIPHPQGHEEGVPAMLQRVVTREIERKHQAASFSTPEWASQLPVSQFDTFWLY